MSFYFVTLQLTREWDIKFFFYTFGEYYSDRKIFKKKKNSDRKGPPKQSNAGEFDFLFFAITTTLQYYSSCKLADGYSPKLTTNHKGL